MGSAITIGGSISTQIIRDKIVYASEEYGRYQPPIASESYFRKIFSNSPASDILNDSMYNQERYVGCRVLLYGNKNNEKWEFIFDGDLSNLATDINNIVPNNGSNFTTDSDWFMIEFYDEIDVNLKINGVFGWNSAFTLLSGRGSPGVGGGDVAYSAVGSSWLYKEEWIKQAYASVFGYTPSDVDEGRICWLPTAQRTFYKLPRQNIRFSDDSGIQANPNRTYYNQDYDIIESTSTGDHVDIKNMVFSRIHNHIVNGSWDFTGSIPSDISTYLAMLKGVYAGSSMGIVAVYGLQNHDNSGQRAIYVKPVGITHVRLNYVTSSGRVDKVQATLKAVNTKKIRLSKQFDTYNDMYEGWSGDYNGSTIGTVLRLGDLFLTKSLKNNPTIKFIIRDNSLHVISKPTDVTIRTYSGTYAKRYFMYE